MNQNQPLFARQPIYNEKLVVEGYELLFRPADASQAFDEDQATSDVILNAFTEVGLSKATESSCAYINFPTNWLMEPPPFEPKSVVIEILETVEATAELVASVKTLKSKGYKIALDDFEYDISKSELIELADIIKIDVLEIKGTELETLIDQLRPYEKVLLAEKVEDYQTFSQCQQLGCSLFQGYFLCRPQLVEGNVLPANKLVVMRLLADLQKPDVTIKELENSIANDPTLSIKLLKIINSAQYGLTKTVDSLQKAIVLLGLEKLKSWASIIALSKLADKPSELLSLTLTRAKMLELLAHEVGAMDADKYFTVGLFSSIDAFFDQSKENILETLPLESEISDALLEFKGPIGTLLQASIHHEQGEWGKINWSSLIEMGINDEKLENAYTNGLRWALEILSSLLQE
ncbi:MAG: HDOD domain-containing protein [Pseudomonadales bacterium]|nr:HDOD domain-containing protein [Pseudomonadales bacterium]